MQPTTSQIVAAVVAVLLTTGLFHQATLVPMAEMPIAAVELA